MALCRTCHRPIPCHCHLTPPVEISPGIYLDTSRTDHPKDTTVTEPLTTQQHDEDVEDAAYRDDVREPLEAAGWHETAEDFVVAPNGALWTETNTCLDSGIDAPDKKWSVSFDSGVPAPVIVAAALAAAGTDVPALLADNQHLRQQLAAARSQAITWAADLIDEKLTAEPDHNRASALYELLLRLRGELPCTCARCGGLHAKECSKYVPGHELISRHNQLAVYRAAARPAATTHQDNPA